MKLKQTFFALIRRLSYSGFLLFVLFYGLQLALEALGISPDADMMIKSAKIASLVAMNVHGDREVDEITATFGADLRRYILRTYRFVRGYVWVAVVCAATVSYLPMLACSYVPISTRYQTLVDIYLPNIAALFPIFVYTFTN